MFASILSISIGASLGAILRWGLSTKLNSFFPAIPPGTLVANLIGAYLIGLALAFFGNNPHISSEWRLFIITGFLGGLTTFSTFSAEVTSILQDGRLLWAFSAISLHVLGSLMMTFLGILSISFIRYLKGIH